MLEKTVFIDSTAGRCQQERAATFTIKEDECGNVVVDVNLGCGAHQVFMAADIKEFAELIKE